ncbi:hypothetical protein DY000_02013606 [Brassica cretica]|uniref:Uncharacterized protein n=1 Tax=Brassica cretica TaxID=69181 RepID=A0ABQ7CSR2_BRACR|nr:hypothetical protein DY000_02013606 [Brassica cretica]
MRRRQRRNAGDLKIGKLRSDDFNSPLSRPFYNNRTIDSPLFQPTGQTISRRSYEGFREGTAEPESREHIVWRRPM